MYLFFDELQRMAGWENTINAFRVDWIATSTSPANAYCFRRNTPPICPAAVEIKMLPLSFAEFIDFHGFPLFKRSKRARRVRKDGS